MLCNKCKCEKNEDLFEIRKDRGCFRTVCKDCRNARQRTKYPETSKNLSERRKEIRINNKEEANEKARERYWKNREALLDKARNRTGYGSWTNNINEWRIKNKNKIAAHQAVHRAVKSGKLSRPDRCFLCGNVGKIQAHHHDYDRPLDVIWPCVSCHKMIHSKYFNKGGGDAS